MIEKNKLVTMARFAQKLDNTGEFEKADYVTELMRNAVAGNKDAIREAQNLSDWAKTHQQNADRSNQGLWDGISGAGKALWNGAKALGKGAYESMAGTGQFLGDYASLPGAALQSGKEGLVNVARDVVRGTPEWQAIQNKNSQGSAQASQMINAAVANAVKSHASGDGGWSVLNQQIAAFPPALQEQAKQKFMAATKQFGSGATTSPQAAQTANQLQNLTKPTENIPSAASMV